MLEVSSRTIQLEIRRNPSNRSPNDPRLEFRVPACDYHAVFLSRGTNSTQSERASTDSVTVTGRHADRLSFTTLFGS